MMDQIQFENTAIQYLDQSLTSEEARLFEQFLAENPQHLQRINSLRETIVVYQSLPKEEPDPLLLNSYHESLQSTLHTVFANQKKKRSRLPAFRWAFSLGMLCLLGVWGTGFWLGQQNANTIIIMPDEGLALPIARQELYDMKGYFQEAEILLLGIQHTARRSHISQTELDYFRHFSAELAIQSAALQNSAVDIGDVQLLQLLTRLELLFYQLANVSEKEQMATIIRLEKMIHHLNIMYELRSLNRLIDVNREEIPA